MKGDCSEQGKGSPVQSPNVMIKLLGTLDIISACILAAQGYSLEVPLGMIIIIPILLGIKAFLALENFFSWIDIVVGITIIIGYFAPAPAILALILITIMFIKGLISVCSV